MNLHTILRTVAAAAVIQFALAQNQGEKQVSLQFLAFPHQNPPEPIELLTGEGTTIPIDIPGNELSPAYRVKGLSSIVVGVTKEGAEKKPVFETLAKAPALASTKQIILLLRKGDHNSDGFLMVPVDGDLAKFAGGNYFFINASNLAVAGKIGDKTFALKPGQRSLVQPNPNHPNGGCQVTLSFQKEEKWKAFYDTRWTVNKRFRSLIFFYQDPETGSLGVAPIIQML